MRNAAQGPDNKVWHISNVAGNMLIRPVNDAENTVQSDVLTLQRSGNVGIGTTGPQFKLEVNGSAMIDGIQTFIKPGNNGTVSASFFCAGSQFGTTGSAIGQKRISDGVYFQPDVTVGSPVECICVRIP